MMRYINYLKYVIRHKWFVFKAGMKYFPSLHMFWRLIVHDISKFTPLEFIAYAKTFYKSDGTSQYDETMEFNQAWNHHQKCNLHHWQYWILKFDRGDIEELPMPEIYIQEMIADWLGAGKAITGRYDNIFNWYEYAQPTKYMNSITKIRVEEILEALKGKV